MHTIEPANLEMLGKEEIFRDRRFFGVLRVLNSKTKEESGLSFHFQIDVISKFEGSIFF